MSRGPRLDDKTLSLIEALVEEPRRSFTDLAAEMGRSEAWVRQRVKALREEGLVRFGIAANPLIMGFGAMGYVGVRTDGDPATIHRLAELEGVSYVVQTTGRFNALVEVFTSRHDELVEFCDRRLGATEGVDDWETFGVVQIVKEVYPWKAP